MADFSSKKHIVKLRKEVINARERWKKLVEENTFITRSAKGIGKHSPKKTLYIARSGAWWTEMKDEIAAMENKITRAGYVGSKKPRTLWLPTVIEFPKKITLKTYQAVSSREITLPQARVVAKKAGLGEKLSARSRYGNRSITGRNYKLRAKYKNRRIYHSFTEWAVCICHDETSIPRLMKSPVKMISARCNIKGVIGSHGNSTLVIRRSVPYRKSNRLGE